MSHRRDQQAYEKKIRKAKAKSNADLAQRLATRRPTYTLDRLVKERRDIIPSYCCSVRSW